MERTRAEHIAWCKQRAHEAMNYSGNYADAVTSMLFDLGKHAETVRAAELGRMLMLTVKDKRSAVEFIDGFM